MTRFSTTRPQIAWSRGGTTAAAAAAASEPSSLPHTIFGRCSAVWQVPAAVSASAFSHVLRPAPQVGKELWEWNFKSAAA